MSQTAVNRNFDQAFPGMLGDIRPNTVESFLAEGSVRFGIGLSAGTDVDRQVIESALVGDTFRGIAIHQHVEQAITTGVSQYDDKEAVGVLRKGTIWMPVEDSQKAIIAVDDPAFIEVVIGAPERGKVTGVSTANLATGGTVRKVDVGLALALIEIDL